MAKNIEGVVVSTKMQKAVVIRIKRTFRHPLYKKVITRHKKIKAKNLLEDVALGNVVNIKEVRPVARDIHFEVVSKVKKLK